MQDRSQNAKAIEVLAFFEAANGALLSLVVTISGISASVKGEATNLHYS